MQALGIPPNVASAEALMQASGSCSHLSDRVNQLIAPFQAALAAAQLTQMSPLPSEPTLTNPTLAAAHMLPEHRLPAGFTDAAQNMLVGQVAALPTPPLTHVAPRWQAGFERQVPTERRSHDQSSGAGPDVAEHQIGMLPVALASSLEKSSGSVPAASEQETLETASGSGPPTAAPVTPVARSESGEASSSCSV